MPEGNRCESDTVLKYARMSPALGIDRGAQKVQPLVSPVTVLILARSIWDFLGGRWVVLRGGGGGRRGGGGLSEKEVHVLDEFARDRRQGDLLELAILQQPLIEHG